MSHDRIFEIDTSPVKDSGGWLVASDLYEAPGFIGAVADYVYDEGVDRDTEILDFIMTALNNSLIAFNEVEKAIVFLPGFRRDYFAKRFREFKKQAEAMSFEDFIEENHSLRRHNLVQTINNKFDTYIYMGYCKSLDQFVRQMIEGEKYYFGGVVGFHY